MNEKLTREEEFVRGLGGRFKVMQDTMIKIGELALENNFKEAFTQSLGLQNESLTIVVMLTTLQEMTVNTKAIAKKIEQAVLEHEEENSMLDDIERSIERSIKKYINKEINKEV